MLFGIEINNPGMRHCVVLLETLQVLGREFAEAAAIWFDGGSAFFNLDIIC